MRYPGRFVYEGALVGVEHHRLCLARIGTISRRSLARVCPAPGSGVTSNGVIATLVDQRPQLLEYTDKVSRSRAVLSTFMVSSRSISAFQRPSLGRG